MTSPSQYEFETLAAREPERGLLRDFWDFLKSNKKWWLVPLLFSLILITYVPQISLWLPRTFFR